MSVPPKRLLAIYKSDAYPTLVEATVKDGCEHAIRPTPRTGYYFLES